MVRERVLLGLGLGPLGIVLGLAVGCGPKSSGGDGDGGGRGGGASTTGSVDENGFAQRYATTYCDSIGACCQRSSYAFDRSTCIQNLQSLIGASLSVYLANEKVVFHDDVAGRCIDSVSAALRACTDRELYRDRNSGCSGIITGTVPLGGACSENVECAPASGGDFVECNTGVCARPNEDDIVSPGERVKLGEACAWSCQDAAGGGCSGPASNGMTLANPSGYCSDADGLYCTSGFVCAPLPKLGEPCASGSWCPTDGYCESGTCVARIQTGTCTFRSECVLTSYCDSGTMQCTQRSPNGQPCDDSAQCLSGTCEGDVCRDWSAANSESCAGVDD